MFMTWSARASSLLLLLLASPLPVDAGQAVAMSKLGSNAATQAGAKGKASSNRSASVGDTGATVYTQNSFCRSNNCVNPIFPGLDDLPKLEALQWQCSTNREVSDYMDFCKDAVAYDPALPSPVSEATAVNVLVKDQEDAAMTMFVYHMNGMGFDAWDYQSPSQSDSDCVRSVWKMVCYTYFPRASAGCKSGEQSMYKRPCASSCNNYVLHCGVECCDESVACVFSNPEYDASGKLELTQTGYIDAMGPSATCTGSAKHTTSSPLLLLFCIFGFHWAGATTMTKEERREGFGAGRRGLPKCLMLCLVVSLAFLLQGCDINIPRHYVGNWQKEPNYLQVFSYLPPGQPKTSAVLNSCSQSNVPATQQCNGRGYCRSFSQNSFAAQQGGNLAFCQCERDWAGPECTARRKSQLKAFFISLFLGPFGGDYFYLGFPLWGIAKLSTFGFPLGMTLIFGFPLWTLAVCGAWWLIDIVRIASGPVYASDFRVSTDMPHWVAMLTLIFLSMIIGFGVSVYGYLFLRKQRRKDTLDLKSQEEARHWAPTKEHTKQFGGPQFIPPTFPKGSQIMSGPVEFSGYGATLPLPVPTAKVPFAFSNPYPDAPPYVGPFGPAGVEGMGSPTPAAIGLSPPHMIPGLQHSVGPKYKNRNQMDLDDPDAGH